MVNLRVLPQPQNLSFHLCEIKLSVVNFLSLASPGSFGQPTILSSEKPVLLPAPRWPPSHSSASAPPTLFCWSLLTQVPHPQSLHCLCVCIPLLAASSNPR